MVWIKAKDEDIYKVKYNGKEAIGLKWIYKITYNEDGTAQKHNSKRIISATWDRFLKTFAPIVHLETIQMVLILAVELQVF